MRVPAYVRRALALWQQWRFEQRRSNRARSIRKAVPALAALDMARDEIARQHKPGARAIDMRKRRIVTERLMHELGRA